MDIRLSFARLLEELQPLDSQREAARRHVTAIRSCLRSAYGLKNLFLVGSASRDTFIRGRSDVDVFAVISRKDARWGGRYVSSDTALDKLRIALKLRFPRTEVYRDVQAIVVPFADCVVDVVPAVYERPAEGGWPIFSMPDGAGSWMPTNPSRHNAYLRKEDTAAGGKIRRTAQLLKFWRECRTPRVALSSFHLELVLATTGICRGPKSYPACLAELFRALDDRECRGIRDPVGIAGYIPAAKTERQRLATVRSIRDSRYHAEAALRAEQAGKQREARRQWSIVFNSQVPCLRE